jgi:hypothetical protein
LYDGRGVELAYLRRQAQFTETGSGECRRYAVIEHASPDSLEYRSEEGISPGTDCALTHIRHLAVYDGLILRPAFVRPRFLGPTKLVEAIVILNDTCAAVEV